MKARTVAERSGTICNSGWSTRTVLVHGPEPDPTDTPVPEPTQEPTEPPPTDTPTPTPTNTSVPARPSSPPTQFESRPHSTHDVLENGRMVIKARLQLYWNDSGGSSAVYRLKLSGNAQVVDGGTLPHAKPGKVSVIVENLDLIRPTRSRSRQ